MSLCLEIWIMEEMAMDDMTFIIVRTRYVLHRDADKWWWWWWHLINNVKYQLHCMMSLLTNYLALIYAKFLAAKFVKPVNIVTESSIFNSPPHVGKFSIFREFINIWMGLTLIFTLIYATIAVFRLNIHQKGGEPLNRLNWSKRLKFKLTVLICTWQPWQVPLLLELNEILQDGCPRYMWLHRTFEGGGGAGGGK